MPFHTLYRCDAIIPRLLAHNYAARRILTIFKKILQAARSLLAISFVELDSDSPVAQCRGSNQCGP